MRNKSSNPIWLKPRLKPFWFDTKSDRATNDYSKNVPDQTRSDSSKKTLDPFSRKNFSNWWYNSTKMKKNMKRKSLKAKYCDGSGIKWWVKHIHVFTYKKKKKTLR